MYIDLTHTYGYDMPVYLGDSPAVWQQKCFLEKDLLNGFDLTASMHVGTHMDSPMHMVAGGQSMAAFGPDKLIGLGALVDARGKNTIDESLLENISLREGDIILVLTGWSQYYRTEKYFEKFPLVTEGFAKKLAEAKVKILGLDTSSPDDTPFVVHKLLLGNEILIIENLTNLEALVNKNFEIQALPAKFDFDGAPARVIAKII